MSHACKSANLEVVQALLAAGADPNLEDRTPRQATPLHYAADAYAGDDTGDAKYEEVIKALIEAGAVGLVDRNQKLPDVGPDADFAVTEMLSKAEKAGVQARKDQKQRRLDYANQLMMNKQLEYQNGCSAAMVSVMDAGSHEGYKGSQHM